MIWNWLTFVQKRICRRIIYTTNYENHTILNFIYLSLFVPPELKKYKIVLGNWKFKQEHRFVFGQVYINKWNNTHKQSYIEIWLMVSMDLKSKKKDSDVFCFYKIGLSYMKLQNYNKIRINDLLNGRVKWFWAETK